MKTTSSLKFLLPLFLATGMSHATVLIGNGVNNGEIDAAGTSWTATSGFYSTEGDFTSTLTSGPFGEQTPGSSSFYVSADGGATIVSATILLNEGDELTFAYDYLSQHANSVDMSFALIDGLGFSQTLDAFTSSGISGFTLHETTAIFTGETGAYLLQITYSPSVDAADINLDRIYLANAVPEPSSALLLSGGLGLALLRRKRRAA